MKPGTRVQTHPATDAWMRGDRYGTVTGVGRPRSYIDGATGQTTHVRPIRVNLDKSGRTVRFHPSNLMEIES